MHLFTFPRVRVPLLPPVVCSSFLLFLSLLALAHSSTPASKLAATLIYSLALADSKIPGPSSRAIYLAYSTVAIFIRRRHVERVSVKRQILTESICNHAGLLVCTLASAHMDSQAPNCNGFDADAASVAPSTRRSGSVASSYWHPRDSGDFERPSRKWRPSWMTRSVYVSSP